jgi:hypothetical protein
MLSTRRCCGVQQQGGWRGAKQGVATALPSPTTVPACRAGRLGTDTLAFPWAACLPELCAARVQLPVGASADHPYRAHGRARVLPRRVGRTQGRHHLVSHIRVVVPRPGNNGGGARGGGHAAGGGGGHEARGGGLLMEDSRNELEMSSLNPSWRCPVPLPTHSNQS